MTLSVTSQSSVTLLQRILTHTSGYNVVVHQDNAPFLAEWSKTLSECNVDQAHYTLFDQSSQIPTSWCHNNNNNHRIANPPSPNLPSFFFTVMELCWD